MSAAVQGEARRGDACTKGRNIVTLWRTMHQDATLFLLSFTPFIMALARINSCQGIGLDPSFV